MVGSVLNFTEFCNCCFMLHFFCVLYVCYRDACRFIYLQIKSSPFLAHQSTVKIKVLTLCQNWVKKRFVNMWGSESILNGVIFVYVITDKIILCSSVCYKNKNIDPVWEVGEALILDY